jgi:hypothetical protein
MRTFPNLFSSSQDVLRERTRIVTLRE